MRPEVNYTPISFWRIGIEYLHLAEITISELIKSDNKFLIVADSEITIEQYERETRWSDHQVIVPTLFVFFHGIELTLKGFVVAGSQELNFKHALTALLDRYTATFGRDDLSDLISKYIRPNSMPELIKIFLASSDSNIDNYHQAFRYPVSTKGTLFKHSELKSKGYDGLPFFMNLEADIKKIRALSVARGSSLVNSK